MVELAVTTVTGSLAGGGEEPEYKKDTAGVSAP